MFEAYSERQNQLVAVVVASPGDAHGYLEQSHRTGHDAYPESDPRLALKTFKTQNELYGFVNAVVIDVSRFGSVANPASLREFSAAVRKINPEVPIIGYSSKSWRGMQLRALSMFGVLDGVVGGKNISPQGVLNVHQQATSRRKPQAENTRRLKF